MNSEFDCIICYEKLLEYPSKITSCKHTFHERCINRWLSTNSTCPICRVVLVMDLDTGEAPVSINVNSVRSGVLLLNEVPSLITEPYYYRVIIILLIIFLVLLGLISTLILLLYNRSSPEIIILSYISVGSLSSVCIIVLVRFFYLVCRYGLSVFIE